MGEGVIFTRMIPAPGVIVKYGLALGIAAAGVLLLVNLYAGYRHLQKARTASAANLEGVRRPAPAFEAVDQEGRAVTLETLRGKVWVAGFVFTNCQGPCPVITRRMAEIQERVRDLENARLVSLSVDPARDTPEVLQDYARRNGAEEGRWLFLTGEPEAILRVVKEGFLTAVQPVEGSDQVIHGTMLAVVDARGEIRGFFEGLAADAPERVAERLRALHGE